MEEFKKIVKKTKGACAEYYRRVLATYNRCHISVEKILEGIPEHELFIEHLQNRYQEDEQEIKQVKDLDEWILKNAVAHAAISIHLLEDQLCLSPAMIEGVKNQAAKQWLNMRIISDFSSLLDLKAQQQRPIHGRSSSMTNMAPLHKVF